MSLIPPQTPLSAALSLGLPAGFGLLAGSAAADDGDFAPNAYVSLSGTHLAHSAVDLFAADPADKIGDLSPSSPGDPGHDVRLELGADITQHWALRARLSSVVLSPMEQSLAQFGIQEPGVSPPGIVNTQTSARSDLALMFFDLERVDEIPVTTGQLSTFIGLRALKYSSEIGYGYQTTGKTGEYDNHFVEDGIGFGPRIGLDYSRPIGTGGMELTTGMAAGVLHLRRSSSFAQTHDAVVTVTPGEKESLVFNPSAAIGLRGPLSDTSTWEIGYRAEAFTNLPTAHLDATFDGGHRADLRDVVNHGLWLGVTFNF